MKLNITAGIFMMLTMQSGCSDDSHFNSSAYESLKSTVNAEEDRQEPVEVRASPSSEDNSQDASYEEDPLEEEILAETPVVISGSYLSCVLNNLDVDCSIRERSSDGYEVSVLYFSDTEAGPTLILDQYLTESLFTFAAPDFSAGKVIAKIQSPQKTRFIQIFMKEWQQGGLNTQELSKLPGKAEIVQDPLSPGDDMVTADQKSMPVDEEVEPVKITEFNTNTSIHLGNGQWPLGTQGCEGLEENKESLFGANYTLETEVQEGSVLKVVKIDKLCGVDASNNELRIYNSEDDTMVRQFILVPGSASFNSGPLDLPQGRYRIQIYSSPFDPVTRIRGEDDFLAKGIGFEFLGGVSFGEPFESD